MHKIIKNISDQSFFIYGSFDIKSNTFDKQSNSKSIKVRKVKSEILENVTTLSYSEQSILREFYLQGSDAIPLPLQNATVAGLISKRILYQVGSFGGVTHGEPCFNYSIASTAKKYINTIPASIGLPAEQTEEAKQMIIANRPEWMKNRW